MLMTISVIIPIYNVGGFLAKTLDSVVNQTYKDIEIICVNDGSTDDSQEILQEYSAKDPRIQIVSQENKGLYVARQSGIKAAHGDYIVFVDGDDWLEPDCCEEIAHIVQETDADIIQYGAFVETFGHDIPETKWFDAWFNAKTDRLEGREEMLRACYQEKRISWNIITKAFKTELLRQVISYESEDRINALEDFLSSFFAFYFAKTWCRLDRRLYHYRMGVGLSTKHQVSVSDLRRDLQAYKGIRTIKNFVEDEANHVPENVRMFVEQYVISHFAEHFFHFIFVRMNNECDPVEWSDALAEEVGPYVALHVLASRIAKRREVIMTQERHINEQHGRIEEQERLVRERDALLERERLSSQQRIEVLARKKIRMTRALYAALVVIVLLLFIIMRSI